MLKRLRIKFILINMLIVTMMLGGIFGLLYYSTSQNLQSESLRMMERIALDPMQLSRPNGMQADVQLPYFTILVGRDGELEELGGGFFDLSDETALQTLATVAQSSDASSGILPSYQLRFSRFETPMGQVLVFADMTSEQSTLRHLIETFLVVGAAAYLVFFGISILLARWAVRPVDAAWKQQKQFVADASHELKTPLTVIMTNAELLQSAKCSPEEEAQFTGNILTVAHQMRGLVESLLDLARLDTGKRLAKKQSFSLSDAVSASAMLFEPVFFENGMQFSYEIAPELRMLGTEGQLRQLTEILLDNAAKYASPGGATTLNLKKVQHHHCLLEVSNDGEAISKEDLPNLFKRFYRADKVRTMNHSYGLGLSIAQSIVQEHHGKITVQSENGRNSFFVLLPLFK